MATIKKSIESEISDLYEFFFATKMHLYFPYSSYEKHVHLVAKTGSGKSELIKLMLYDLIRKSAEKRNKSIVLIAPDYDLPTEVLRFSLNQGVNKKRVVFLDPSIKDTANRLLGENFIKDKYIFSINPFDLSNPTEERINIYKQYLTSAFFEIIKDKVELSGNMEPIVKSCISTLLRLKNTSIADFKDFLDDEKNERLVNESIANEPNTFISCKSSNKSGPLSE